MLSLPSAPDARVTADEDPIDAEFVELDALFSPPPVPALREFDPEVTATRLAELSGFLPAVPRYEAPPSSRSAADESYFFAPPPTTAGGPLALPRAKPRSPKPSRTA